MNKSFELTVNLEVLEPPEGFLATPEAISREMGVPQEAVMETTVFRANGGFIAVLSGMDRRLNLKTLMSELDHQWVTYPTKDEWKELGCIDRKHPIVLASDPRVSIVIDAQLLSHHELVFKGHKGRLFKVARSGIMIATRAKPMGGISLPNSWQ